MYFNIKENRAMTIKKIIATCSYVFILSSCYSCPPKETTLKIENALIQIQADDPGLGM